MTDEPEETELEWSEGAKWVVEGEFCKFDDPVKLGEQEVLGMSMVGGDVYLLLASDMKLHKLEVAKGWPSKAVLTEIRQKGRSECQGAHESHAPDKGRDCVKA